MAEQKTNVMRILDQKKIPYTAHQYPCPNGAVDGVTVAGLIGADPAQVFKTLVTRGATGQYYVFAVPVSVELDLKAAAKAAGEKSIEMIKQSELSPLTGYVHGGCSPVGMKKQLKTFVDVSAQALESIVVSAGKVGVQVELSPQELCGLVRGVLAPVTSAELQK